MEIGNQIFSAILILFLNEIGLNDCRRIGGGGSIFSKPKTPSKTSFNSRPGQIRTFHSSFYLEELFNNISTQIATIFSFWDGSHANPSMVQL